MAVKLTTESKGRFAEMILGPFTTQEAEKTYGDIDEEFASKFRSDVLKEEGWE